MVGINLFRSLLFDCMPDFYKSEKIKRSEFVNGNLRVCTVNCKSNHTKHSGISKNKK